jgi:hypothetical protein
MTDRMDRPMAKGETTDKKAATGTGAAVGGALGGIGGGAAAGAAAGGMTGPVGAVVGAVAGRSMAKADPAVEDRYWRDNHASRPYVASGTTYDDYAPAYRSGVDAYTRDPNRHFDDMEPELRSNWGTTRGSSKLEWDDARHASRDAWERVSNATERAIPGDSDGDGR